MFTVTGAGIIAPESEIKEYATQFDSVVISFKMVAKDPYKVLRHFYTCSVLVPLKYLETARDKLKPGQFVQVRLGELKGRQTDGGAVFNNIQTKWQWIEFFNGVPEPERKEDI